MCLKPQLIDNPYLGLESVGLNRFHDCHSKKIPVPCGNCSSCIALRQNYFIQRCQMESISHHLFFLTVTYKPAEIPKRIVNDRCLFFPDWSDVRNMIKRIRFRGYKLSYLFVSEYGSEKHRPHFHAIISVPKGPKDTYHDIHNLECELYDLFLDEWKRNYGTDKYPDYHKLLDLVRTPFGSTYDLHYIQPSATKAGEADVAFYVTKYVTKSDEWVERLKRALKLNLSPEEFDEEWKYFRPRACISKSFGDYKNVEVREHIRKGIDLALDSQSPFPFFINPITGQTFPLAPVFKKRFLTLQDQEKFFSFSEYSDGYHEMEEHDLNELNAKDRKLDNIRKMINSRTKSHDYVYQDFECNSEALEEISSVSCSVDSLPDNWQSDFDDSY